MRYVRGLSQGRSSKYDEDDSSQDLPPPPSEGAGPLNDYTPTTPLTTFTYSQIIQALRTSWTSEATATPALNDHVTDQRTFSWGTAGDIVYEVDAATMSTFERGRLDLAFEVWDDFIAVNIRNDQTSGDPGGPTRFASVSYTATGTNASRAFFSIDSITANANNNGYGTTDNTINTGTFNLGRNFNGGEFDGRNGSNVLDNGVFDLTFFARRGFETMLHEAGHGLGLSHPGYYNNGHVSIPNGARFDQDNRRNTIMSYRAEDAGADSNADWNGLFAATPMIYDIAAVQTMYGADTTTRTGATTYGFNNNSGRAVFDFSKNLGSVFAIYDAGGVDTLDASQFTGDSIINLWPGTISSIGQAAGNSGDAMLENIGIAFNTIIENVKGGSGNDVLWGNDASNIIDQGLGGGTARGFGGQDVMIAGNGGEQFDGGDGIDTIDYSRSTAGVDIVFGKVGGGWGNGDSFVDVENIIGSEFDDSVAMDGVDNKIEGRGGNDVLNGGGGINWLLGGAGDDILTGGPGRWVGDLYFAGDEFDGGTGWDIARFTTAVTIDLRPGGVHGGEAREDVFISIEQYNGSPEADIFYGSSFNDRFQGGGEGDYLNGGGGSDTASYADRTSGITVDMTFNNFAAGDETRHPNEVAGRTDGKVSPPDGTWIDTLISMENIEGTNFDDRFLGDERANTFWGLGGNDRFEGDGQGTPQGSWDDMYGGAGDDSFVVGINDLADGGVGNDTATFVGGVLFLNFDTFNFSIGGTAIHVRDIETYTGTNDSDTVIGAAHGETINLGAGGDDYANGRGGDDFLYTSDGFDTLIGDVGFDTIVFHRSMVASWQTGELDSAIAETWASWEAIQGAGGVDVIRTNDWGYAVELRGGAGDDILATGPGQDISDTLKGEAGNDSLNGGAGADAMIGGQGDDTYFVDNVGDTVVEAVAEGTDLVRASIGHALAANVESLILTGSANTSGTGNNLGNTLTGNSGNNRLNGGLGADTMAGRLGDDTYDVDNFGDTVVEGVAQGTDLVQASVSHGLAANVENLTLTGGANTSGTGNNLGNTLTGNSGNNRLNGGLGADTMAGGNGDDTYTVDNVGDTVVEAVAQGTDLVQASVSHTLAANVESLTLTGSANTSGTGNDLGNTLTGNSGDNRLNGGRGADTMAGGAGDDTYTVENVGDTVVEASNAGIDLVRSGLTFSLGGKQVENLTLTGSGDINGTGNTFDNTIAGNSGDNVLNGGTGSDTLTGAAGADTFKFTSAPGATNIDSITDFNVAADTIQLDSAIFNAIVGTGMLTAAQFVANTTGTAQDATDRILYDTNSGELYFDSNGNAAGGRVQFAEIGAGLALTASDFFVV